MNEQAAAELRFDIRIASSDRVLVDIRDFSIAMNRVTFLFGESGIGKSLMAKAIFGLLDPEELHVTINGSPYAHYAAQPSTRRLREQGFFVFQEPSSHLNPLMTLEAQLREGDLSRTPGGMEILRDLWDGSDPRSLLSVYPKPHRPSGGEKQRMLLAMALSKMDMVRIAAPPAETSVFVFDEPTGSLDNRSRDIVLDLLMKRFRERRSTILLITHDYSMISVVQKHWSGLNREFVFREVAPNARRLAVRDFLPETYLGWIKSRHPEERPVSGKPLMSAESGMRVFGRTLTVSRDVAGKDECALEVHRGSITYLKAASGVGKTTLVKMLMGLIKGSRMRVRLGASVLTERTPRTFWQRHVWGTVMTMAFQHADEALNLHSTVLETFTGLPSPTPWSAESIADALKELYDEEISRDFLQRTVGTLSGGQKQKLNLLRCLVLQTDILILDEPLNGLDFSSAVKVISLLERRQKAGKGLLLISHNEEMFDALVSREHTCYLHARSGS